MECLKLVCVYVCVCVNKKGFKVCFSFYLEHATYIVKWDVFKFSVQ